jgi:hypothetical protein
LPGSRQPKITIQYENKKYKIIFNNKAVFSSNNRLYNLLGALKMVTTTSNKKISMYSYIFIEKIPMLPPLRQKK